MNDPDATQASRSGSRLMVLNGTDSNAALAERERADTELTATDLREARRAFELKLRGKRMHPRWIEEHADELFAKAQQQYAEWLAAGRVADSPRAWLVHTAWRRTQDRLDYEHRHGQAVALDDVSYSIADENARTPEQVLLEGDRREQLLEALGELKPEHQTLLKLIYFDNLEIREAGEILGWTAANASYHHKAVLKRLRRLLDGKVDLPEIGAAAAVFVALEEVGAVTVAKAFEWLADAGTALIDRLGDLARRLQPASDPASASVAGSAARAAGVCATALATVCLAGGVIGPGIGGVDLIDSQPTPPPTREILLEQTRASAPATPEARSAPQSKLPIKSPAAARKAASAKAIERSADRDATRSSAAAPRQRSARPPRASGEDQVNAEAAAEPVWTEPVEPRPMSEEENVGSEYEPPPPPSGNSGSSTRETSPATEFGF